MTARPKIVSVTPGGEIDRLLDETNTMLVLLERNGVRYRLDRETGQIERGYDPERVREALAATAGTWAEIDVASAIADLYRAREAGSRMADRP